ncbi:fructosamine kinase family protein [Mucilaginibacter sp. JRF]|uniref:fructosamine kinase family protein n=1 Tax=Mucilaginibacter sp. JRF TaxID=2780088 RepID=UPI00187F0EBB|nr:fructosamine kinase family protein [Mucilaginibacter sp. JRF]MBE9583803.1 fructosamine kinase family protein [Mucilaginibacter sp. JRF]
MKALLNAVEQQLNEHIIRYEPVSGGDINDAYCLHTDSDTYFIKINSKTRFPGMFAAEAKGLSLIASTNTIATPRVILQSDAGYNSYLLLEWLDTKSANASDMQALGEQLATMHRVSADSFGLPYNNYMGSLHQSNKQYLRWADFFIEERLMPMVKLAVDKSLLNNNDLKQFDKLYNNLANLFDEEAPSLIHGDLWGGNYLIANNGKPYLIDPAVSYGHREFDIAMTTLFGGFSNDFYTAYNDAFPLATGWQQRLALWNIYPLLVHLILFGVMYKQQVMGNLSKYI